jgi:hypothetical protein
LLGDNRRGVFFTQLLRVYDYGFDRSRGVMIGLSNFSTSEKVHHYPRPALERNFRATNSEPRLFMSVPDTKDGSPSKNIEASSAVAPDEQAEAKTSRPHKHTAIARQRHNYGRPSFGMGYAEYTRMGHSVHFPTGDHHFPV